MKIIATAAFLLTLTTPAVSAMADEPERMRVSNSALDNQPFVLSEAEMDGITAGGRIDGAGWNEFKMEGTKGSELIAGKKPQTTYEGVVLLTSNLRSSLDD